MTVNAALVLILAASALPLRSQAVSFDERWGALSEQGRIEDLRRDIQKLNNSLLTKQSRLRAEAKLDVARVIHALRIRERLCDYHQDDEKLLAACLTEALEIAKAPARKNEAFAKLCANVASPARKIDCEREAESEIGYVRRVEKGLEKINARGAGEDVRSSAVSMMADALLWESVHPEPLGPAPGKITLPPPSLPASPARLPAGKR